MRWAATRIVPTAGAMLLTVVGLDLATANGPGPSAHPGLVPTIPIGEEQESNSLPVFDWLDEAYEPPACVATAYETAYEEPGLTMSPCRQGTVGCTCSCHRCRNASRFYVAGVVGASFATLTATDAPSSNDPVFTSGGIAGMSFQMLDRAWRVEVEGRARNAISDTTTLADGVSASSLTASGGWSATANLWRDFDVTERLTAYAGGGIGGGGYQFSVNQEYPVPNVTVTGANTVSGFAWQVGGGLAFALTDRITLDLGYRFFELASGSATAVATQGGLPVPDGTATFNAGFSASELFFAIRIYEPFRGWR